MAENLPKEYSRHLPRSSRVNREILNYYLQYGRERDLEKFMRLYSPVSSKNSSECGSTSSSENSAKFQRLFNLNESTNIKTNLKHRKIKKHDEDKENKHCVAEKNIPIVTLKNKVKLHAVSCEDLQTPEKSKRIEIETRTPESITKSTRRLEWDSLGDVGYKKSMSTSNISILERSLLKELFQTTMITKSSETDLTNLKLNPQTNVTENTLPLASSTFTDSQNVTLHKGKCANRKHISQSTNTSHSLRKIDDKSSQTSLKYLRTNTRESLISFSSENGASSSVVCGTVTPSSFEYYSSKSSIKSGSTGNDSKKSSIKSGSTGNDSKSCETILQHKNRKSSQEQKVNELTNKPITVLGEKKDIDRGLKTSFVTKVQAKNYEQNKEKEKISQNNEYVLPTSSIISHCSQLDLEVQLICALVEAKSLTLSEKKQLIHDIIKHISRLGITNRDHDEIKKSVNISLEEEQQLSKTPQNSTYINNISDNDGIELNLKDTSKVKDSMSENYKTDLFKTEIFKVDSIEFDGIEKDNNSNCEKKMHTNVLDQHMEIATKRIEKSPSISTSSQEQITQKKNNASEEQNIKMGEWLDPITQSEIEYEKKGEISYANDILLEDERNEQIHWIEAEIKRLESLRYLLSKETRKNNNAPSVTDKGKQAFPRTEETTNKRSCNKKEINSNSSSNELYSIIEKISIPYQSTEKTLKRNEKKKNTLNDITADMTSNENETVNKKRSTTTNRQTLTSKNLQTLPRQQRSRINTPLGSNDSISVCSFVRQRKSEFIEKYRKTKMFFQEQRKLKPFSKNDQIHTSGSYGISENVPINNHYSLPNAMTQSQNRIIFPQQHSLPKSTSNKINLIESVSFQINANEKNKVGSSSTLFCSSSEMSVPMGSYMASTSLTTTTHKYDDVAGTGMFGVGVQTSDSMLRTQPIFCQNHTTIADKRDIHLSNFIPASVQVKSKSIAYVITFDDKPFAADKFKFESKNSSSFAEESSPLTLQDYLERARPKFCAHTNERKAILNEIQTLRQARGEKIQMLVENFSITSLDKEINRLPPPPTSYLRIFPTKEMKSITNKRFSKLPEVLEKDERFKEERRRRNNRILRDLFNKRLQKRVRSGKLSLNHSKTII